MLSCSVKLTWWNTSQFLKEMSDGNLIPKTKFNHCGFDRDGNKAQKTHGFDKYTFSDNFCW